MQWAIVGEDRIEASPELRGVDAKCPCCGDRVAAKCGTIVAWHWAHRSLDCDPWSEPESEWHREWKSCFPKEWQEVKIGEHRADVKTPNVVIELQHSPISQETIADRESFYGKIVWVVNAIDFNLDVRPKADYATFRWKWPRKTWWTAQKPLFFDLGFNGILEVKKINHDTPCGGWGKLHPNRSEFLKRIRVLSEGDSKDLWTSDPGIISSVLNGNPAKQCHTDRERLVMFVGQKLANIVIRGECNRPKSEEITCPGELLIVHFKWCNQYRIFCDFCRRPLAIDKYESGPIPHKTAAACAKYLSIVELENQYDAAIWRSKSLRVRWASDTSKSNTINRGPNRSDFETNSQPYDWNIL